MTWIILLINVFIVVAPLCDGDSVIVYVLIAVALIE